MTKLRSFIIGVTIAGSLLMFSIVYFIVSFGCKSIIVKQAEHTAKEFSNMIYNSVSQVMKAGGDKDDLQEFLNASLLHEDVEDYTVDIFYYDAHKIKKLGQNKSEIETEVLEIFARHEEINTRKNDIVSYYFPLKAKKECLECHEKNQEGDVLGVVAARKNLTATIEQANKKISWLLLLITPFPIVCSMLLALYISKKMNKSMLSLQKRVEKVNKISDLKEFEVDEIDFTFAEFNSFFGELKRILTKLREMAIDKDILHRELQLHEKLVITSEVIKDWKSQIKNIIREMYAIINIRLLFALFKTAEGTYELEVFWAGIPKKETEKTMEASIKKTLLADCAERLVIIHNVVMHNSCIIEISEKEMITDMQQLMFKNPHVGGIMGIGASISQSDDSAAGVVVDSMLSSLLNVVGFLRSIYKYTQKLEYYATRDPLTNLYNQRVFWELLNYEVIRAKKHGYNFMLLVIDMDNFKSINDTYGHAFGDRIIQNFGKSLRKLLCDGEVIARYGGDEFVVFFPLMDEKHQFLPNIILEKLKETGVKAPDGREVKATISIGSAVYPDHAREPKEMFLIADNMMYRAKALGKDKICHPRPEDIVEVFQNMGEKNIVIARAIEEKRIIPDFQPLMQMNNGEITAYEFLMRIQLSDRLMSAGEFIDIATEMGVINKMDNLLMERIFEKVREKQYQGLMFLNLSPKAFVLENFTDRVLRMVSEYGIDPQKIVFEITERDTVKNLNLLENIFRDLKDKGFQFAIDDFGTGFSSYQYLRQFPVDFLKIEGDLIRGLGGDQSIYKAIVKSIATLARELKIKTVAEYVENEKIFQAVKEIEIDYGQGYFIGRPSQTLL